MKIWAHTLVKNEERHLWFAVTSVIDCVDKLLLWDTGSSDKTPAIIKELKKSYPEKIEVRNVGPVDINEFTKVRQEMLDQTKGDWVLLVDGDEVWWDESIKELVDLIRERGEWLDSIVSRYINLVGDIFHFLPEKAGRYEIDGRKGFLSIRAMNRKIPGLHVAKPHGQQGFFDKDGKLIQEREKNKRFHLEKPCYLHFTNLVRSSTLEKDKQVPKRKIKFKYSRGIPFPSDFYYPEVFFRKRPKIVPSPWRKSSTKYKLRSLIYDLLLRVFRGILIGKARSGY